MNMRSAALMALLSFSSLWLSGCSGLHYLIQAGRGQMELINRARPIPEVIQDERTPPRIRALLTEIPKIKKFGEENGLKPTKNYTEYVKLNRPAAVWVISACEPLRFKAKEWSFPIVGSFPYLGWFDPDNAREYGEDLKKEGWDVDLRRANAFSTLGWFRDAVLSTMIPEGKEALGGLVNVVLHESVHATLYIKNQSYFNESLASFIADHLTLTYLDQTKGPESAEKKAYVEAENYSLNVGQRFHETYLKLAALYASSQSESEKRLEKQKILESLQKELGFKRDINNATLIQYKTYNTGTAEFERLFEKCGKNWLRFLGTLRSLEPSSFPKPQLDEIGPVIERLE